MKFKVTDLCDEFPTETTTATQGLVNYGGLKSFFGQIVTVKVFEDNTLVREALTQDGTGKVLVVDGDGSLNCALLGDLVANLAKKNNWSGIIVNGCIRDSVEVATVSIGIKALNVHPKKSKKEGKGSRDLPVSFCGITFKNGEFVYSDQDGIIVSSRNLLQS